MKSVPQIEGIKVIVKKQITFIVKHFSLLSLMGRELEFNCPSCGHQSNGKYCPNCGEKRINSDSLKIKHFLGQLFSALTFSDSKFLRTLKLTLKNPGLISADYMIGKRKVYTPPISMFFIANIIFFFILPVSTFTSGFDNLNPNSNVGVWAYNKIAKMSADNKQTQEEIIVEIKKESEQNAKSLFIIMVFLFSLVFALLYMKQRTFYFAHLIYSLNLMTNLLLIVFIAIPILIYFGINMLVDKGELANKINYDIPLLLIPLFAIIFFIIYQSSRAFYRQKRWITFLKSFFALMGFFIMVTLYRRLVLMITLLTF